MEDLWSLSEKEQKEHLLKTEHYLEICKPKKHNSKDYRIWFDYYSYLWEQEILEHELTKGNLELSHELCKKCIFLLHRLESELQGSFLRIHIKICNHLRNLYYTYILLKFKLQKKV